MEQHRYLGYTIRQVHSPTQLNPSRMTWSIFDGETERKRNIGSIEVAKHVIEVMLKYGYWKEITR